MRQKQHDGTILFELPSVMESQPHSTLRWEAQPLEGASGAVIAVEGQPIFLLRQEELESADTRHTLFGRSFLAKCGSQVYHCHTREGLTCEINVLRPVDGRRARLTRPLFGKGRLSTDGELACVWEPVSLLNRKRRFRQLGQDFAMTFEPDRRKAGQGLVRISGALEVESGEGCLLFVCAFLLGLIRRW